MAGNCPASPSFQSDTPFSVVSSGGIINGVSAPDNAGVANNLGLGSYPHVVGSPYGPSPPGGNNRRSFGPLLLNPGASAAPTGLTFGDAGRNALNNPSRLNFDMALLKHIKEREGSDVELRLETFNTFNHRLFRRRRRRGRLPNGKRLPASERRSPSAHSAVWSEDSF